MIEVMRCLVIPIVYWLFIILMNIAYYDCGFCETHYIHYNDVKDAVKVSFRTYKRNKVDAKIPGTNYKITKIATSRYRGSTQQAVLAEKGSSTIVAFRGTKNPKVLMQYMRDYVLHLSNPEDRREIRINNRKATVFNFFLGAFRSLFPKIQSHLQNRNRTYILTGHSLGGALASLLAIKLKSTTIDLWQNIRFSLITFGAPRVGDRRYAKLHDELIPTSRKLRFTNKGDFIPFVPFKPSFMHHSREVYGEVRRRFSWSGIRTTYRLRFCHNGDPSRSCLNRNIRFYMLPVLIVFGYNNHMAYERMLTSTSTRREYLDVKGKSRSSWKSAWDASC